MPVLTVSEIQTHSMIHITVWGDKCFYWIKYMIPFYAAYIIKETQLIHILQWMKFEVKLYVMVRQFFGGARKIFGRGALSAVDMFVHLLYLSKSSVVILGCLALFFKERMLTTIFDSLSNYWSDVIKLMISPCW